MARKFGTKLPKKLYPSGWPSNLRAVLHLNNERRDKFLPPIEQGAAWTVGVWYKVGDTVTYSAVTYRCALTHQARVGQEPDTSDYWVEVV